MRDGEPRVVRHVDEHRRDEVSDAHVAQAGDEAPDQALQRKVYTSATRRGRETRRLTSRKIEEYAMALSPRAWASELTRATVAHHRLPGNAGEEQLDADQDQRDTERGGVQDEGHDLGRQALADAE